MATFAVTYSYAPDSEAARLENREGHLAFLEGLHQSGRLLASGRLGAEGEPGALLIIAGEDADDSVIDGDAIASIAALMDTDPFAQAGLIGSRTIRSWTIVFGAVGNQS